MICPKCGKGEVYNKGANYFGCDNDECDYYNDRMICVLQDAVDNLTKRIVELEERNREGGKKF